MFLYHILLYVHILSAIVMVGISFANGIGKTFADQTKNVNRMTSVSALTMYFNKVLMLPSLVILALSGLGLVYVLRLSMFKDWIFQSVIILFVLFVLFFAGNYYETRLYKIAKAAEENKQLKMPMEYYNIGKRYYVIGSIVTVAILLVLYLMIFKKSLF